MDKYEYRLKLDQIKNLIAVKDYGNAAEMADSINWTKVRNTNTLTMIAKVYEMVGRYEQSREVLMIAYERASVGRGIVKTLVELSIKLKDVDEAEDYYNEFLEIAPGDDSKYILAYKIACLKNSPISDRIAILEELKDREYSEVWAYELAALYSMADMRDKCVATCDELILWFGDGEYVEKAIDLKRRYQPLTPAQEEKYQSLLGDTEMVQISVSADEEEIETVSTSKFDSAVLQDTLEKNIADIENAEDIDEVNYYIENIRNIANEIPYLKSDVVEEENLIQINSEVDEAIKNDFAQLLKEEEDGQMSLSVNEENEQVEGQMSIEDVLAEWEKTARAAEAAIAAAELKKLELAKANAIAEGTSILERLKLYSPVLQTEAKAPVVGTVGAEITRADAPKIVFTDINGEKLNIGNEEEPVEDAAEEIAIMEPEIEAEDIAIEEPALEEAEDSISVADKASEALAALGGAAVAAVAAEEVAADAVEEVAEDAAEAVEDVALPELDIEGLMGEDAPAEEPAAEELPDIEVPSEAAEEIVEAVETVEETVIEETVAEEAVAEEAVAEETVVEEADLLSEPTIELPNIAEALEKETPATIELEVAEETIEEIPETTDAELEGILADGFDIFDETPAEEPVAEETVAEEPAAEELPDIEVPVEAEEEIAEATEEISDELPTLDVAGLMDEVAEPAAEAVEEAPVEKIESDEDLDKLLSQVSKQVMASAEKEEEPVEEEEEEDLPDISMPEENYTDAASMKLNDQQKELFSYFLPVPGMEDQIKQVLFSSKQKGKGVTSLSGNIIIQGEAGSGKTVLATSLIKAIQKMTGNEKAKIGKISAEALNRKDFSALIPRVAGGYLIVDQAGQLKPETAAKMSQAMEGNTKGLVVILEDDKAGIINAMSLDYGFSKKFTEIIKIPIFTIDELVDFGKNYAIEMECVIDEMGVLALYNRINNIQKLDKATTLAEIKEIVDDAIESAEGGGVRKIFAKKYDENDRLILREKDFDVKL